MVLGAIVMNSVATALHGMWAFPDNHSREYTSMASWLELARLLERGRFDLCFFADALGVYEAYEGRSDPAIREAVSFPMNDPAPAVAAMAAVTSDLGFVWTGSTLQEIPFTFARRSSTLDHLTGGRVGWNIVTSYLEKRGPQSRRRGTAEPRRAVPASR